MPSLVTTASCQIKGSPAGPSSNSASTKSSRISEKLIRNVFLLVLTMEKTGARSSEAVFLDKTIFALSRTKHNDEIMANGAKYRKKMLSTGNQILRQTAATPLKPIINGHLNVRSVSNTRVSELRTAILTGPACFALRDKSTLQVSSHQPICANQPQDGMPTKL